MMALIKELYDIQNKINGLIEIIGTNAEEESEVNLDDELKAYSDTLESLEVVKEDLMNQLWNWRLNLETQKARNKERRKILIARDKKIDSTLGFIEDVALDILRSTKNQSLKTDDFDFSIKKTPGKLEHKGLSPAEFREAVPLEFKYVVPKQEIRVDNDKLKEFIKENGDTEYAQFRDEKISF